MKIEKIGAIFLLATMMGGSVAEAQTLDEQVSVLQEKVQQLSDKQQYMPHVGGILRGKYEYEPDLNASRFEVRNARLAVDGNMPFRSSYKLEVDLCDESAIKMKDAWVRIEVPVSRKLADEGRGGALRFTIGQQRMPFCIDAHRNPSAQYFANRSFIAKQVGDMRDVGAAVGYDVVDKHNRKVLSIDAGAYNGSNLDNQKTAWFFTGVKRAKLERKHSPAYSARIQYFPIKGLALIPSVQHQLIAGREANYTSFDFGSYYEWNGLHIEAEYLRKFYAHDAFDDCNAVNAMAIYKQALKKDKSFIQNISYLVRYDYMDDHSDGKKGFEDGRLKMTDAQRHRLTAGVTFSVRNNYFPTDIRFNYEKYWYPHGGTPKESEQDKIVAELMIRF